ncbi:MAG: biotin--[acetyl-CoA-carboxylase] ligase [Caldimonas sp.]
MSTARLATQHIAETGSTSSDLLARVREAAAAGAADFAPCLLVADGQTAGRGRHGRSWHATPGASLTFSLAWPIAAGDFSGLSLAVGTALADALDPPPATTATALPAAWRIGLKWPNDLWLVGTNEDGVERAGRKLGGVLIETAPFGARRVAVIGVGLNVLPQSVDDAASGVAWLAEIDAATTPASALDRVVAPLVAALQRFERAGFAAFADRFAARDVLHGRRVCAGLHGEIEGVGAGVSAHGDLLVRTDHGTVPVASGEVRVRLLGDAAEARQPTSSATPC